MRIQFLIVWLVVVSTNYGQSEIQKRNDYTLEYLEAHRPPGQTRTMLFISNTNDYVNLAIPPGLLVAGIIDHNPDMRQNALYVTSSTGIRLQRLVLLLP